MTKRGCKRKKNGDTLRLEGTKKKQKKKKEEKVEEGAREGNIKTLPSVEGTKKQQRIPKKVQRGERKLVGVK